MSDEINNQAEIPPNFCFPPDLMHLWDERIMKNFNLLFRGYDDEHQIRTNIETLRWNTCVTYDGLASLANNVSYLERSNIPGAFVETGCWMGGSAGMMALVNLQVGKSRRKLHLFDSFLGLPQPSEQDYSQGFEDNFKITKDECTGKLEPINVCIAKRADVENCLFEKVGYPIEFVNIYEGWFQDTIPKVYSKIGPIALLRLDGDFYESTIIALRYFYPLVTNGGIIVIDDWCLAGCRSACEDYFLEVGINPYIHRVDGTVHYFIKNENA